jgi:hypothetical protein
MKMYGIKKPDVENEKSIRKTALKYGLDTATLVTINAADFGPTIKEISGIPDAALFDSAGKYIEYRQSDTACNAGLFGFIPGLSSKGSYNYTGKTTLAEELKTLRTLKGQPLAAGMEGKADFYLLIYWTAYAGRLNKDHVKAWQDLAAQNKQAKIKVIEVNLDFQEHWPEKERKAIMKGTSKKK